MRSITEIQQHILDDISGNPILSALGGNSSSLTARHRALAFVIATAIWTLEVLFGLFKKEINELLDSALPGTVKWYQAQVLNFQYGDILAYINGKYQYAVANVAAQIIAYCAVIEQGNVVIIKTAKDNGGEPEPLSAPELVALLAYVEQIKVAGTYISCLSYDPDNIKVTGTIYYNPIIPIATLQADVESAINNYFKSLPFNGVMKIISLVDAIQNVTGVTDCSLSDIQVSYGAVPYAPVVTHYNSNAGYLKIDPAFPLATTLTYEPYGF